MGASLGIGGSGCTSADTTTYDQGADSALEAGFWTQSHGALKTAFFASHGNPAK